MTHEHTINGKGLLLVEVPSKTWDVSLFNDGKGQSICYTYAKDADDLGTFTVQGLPLGFTYTILGLSDQLTEDQCRGLVDDMQTLIHEDQKWEYWPDYTDSYGQRVLYTARQSFASWLRSLSLDGKQILVMVKQ